MYTNEYAQTTVCISCSNTSIQLVLLHQKLSRTGISQLQFCSFSGLLHFPQHLNTSFCITVTTSYYFLMSSLHYKSWWANSTQEHTMALSLYWHNLLQGYFLILSIPYPLSFPTSASFLPYSYIQSFFHLTSLCILVSSLIFIPNS